MTITLKHPDILFELGLVLDQATLASAVDGINQMLGFKEPDHVLAGASNVSQRIGIWFDRPAGAPDTAAARAALLSSHPTLLSSGITFAFKIGMAFIKDRAQKIFEGMPHRLNDDGIPDAHGDVHLTGIEVQPVPGRQLRTEIHGFEDETIPDVHFDVVTVDTFAVKNGRLQVTSKTDVDKNAAEVAAAVAFALLFPIPGLQNLSQVGRGGGVSTTPSPGPVIQQLLPTDVPLPGAKKLHFNYSDIQVAGDAVLASGQFARADREPAAQISGNPGYAERGDDSVNGFFRLETTDLRTPLKKIVWSSPSKGVQLTTSPNGGSVGVTFDLTQGTDFLLNVLVIDADGLVAKASRKVHVALHLPNGQPSWKQPHEVQVENAHVA